MDAYTIRDAAERLDDLIARAEAGERVEIQRDGRIVARIEATENEAAPKAPFDLAAYYETIKDMPCDPTSSVVEMRKLARY